MPGTHCWKEISKRKGATIVPVSVELEGERRQLIITGPNTGGKTVTLKTVGLLALMAQAGMPVPADRAELPVFDAVLADIGDYQSIEQNLSTFSAHVTNIDFISRTATAQSLVLLDELGSATDPEEGAALAVAIAAHFGRIGCMTIISTHHTSLKVYAANTAGVINASVGFDEITLQPTYELKVGVPGASAGINIAQRLGLNPAIIESARAKLGTQARDVGHFLDKLHADLREAENERLRLKTREQELEREKVRSRRRRAERAASQNSRDGKETRERCCATSNITRAKPSTPYRIARQRKSFPRMPNAGLPRCAANFASNSIRPSLPIPPAPTKAIRTPSRNSSSMSPRATP